MKYNIKINTFYKAVSPTDMRKWYVKNIEDNLLVHYATYMPNGEMVDGGQATLWQFSMFVVEDLDAILDTNMFDFIKI